MNCLLNGNNAKVLAKAVQSLSKFGAELFIEADANGLLLRSLNNSRSAIGSFTFNRHFFERFHVEADTAHYCKITMKACFNAFRNMKQVEYCEIKLCVNELRFEMDIKCKHEQTKKIAITILDEENVTATVRTEDAPNEITACYKIFNEISSSFNALEEEITLDVDENALNVKNFVSGTRVNDKFMRTQFKLAPSELDVYRIAQTTSVTFCLKEFRAYLAFAEAINESVTLQFGDAGSPLFIRIKKLDQLDCLLIMSTLSPDDVTFCDELIRQSELMNTSNATVNIPQKRKSTQSSFMDQQQPEPKRHIRPSETTLSNTSLFQFDEIENNNEGTEKRNSVPEKLTRLTNLPEEPEAMPNSNCSLSVEFYDTEKVGTEDDDLIINQSQNINRRPPVRSIFSRCFEATYFPDEPSPSSQVFVPDSDGED